MTLRLLHITPYYLPNVSFGGPVFSVSSMCEALVKTGIDTTVFTIGYDTSEQYPLVKMVNGVTVHYFACNAGSPCQVSWQLWQALEKTANQYDAVHLHTWWNVLIFRALKILKQSKVPVVVAPRGMMSDYSFTHRKTTLKRIFQTSFGVKLLQDVHLHATSTAEANEMALRCQRDPEDIFVIPNLLNLHPLSGYKAVEGGLTLGFLSRLHHKKGIEVLLDAVAKLPQITKLIIGGRGDDAYEAQLRAQAAQLGISNKIEWQGWVTDENKPAFFEQFQLFVLPSFNENFANVVAEAWAAGKPVVVSSEVGLSDYVQHYKLGWVCEPNTASVVASIETAWNQKEQWPKMGESALQLVAQRFTNQKIVKDYASMYQHMTGLVAVPDKKPMAMVPDTQYVLGINAHHADASAALFKNGILIAAIEEERLTRVKHWAGFPSKAIAFCLQDAGISWQQIKAVALARDPKAKWMTKARFMLKRPEALAFAVRGRLNNADSTASVESRIVEMAAHDGVSQIAEHIYPVEHHRSHLASAFYPSGFEEAALLSVDGSGDFTTTMTGIGHGTNITVLQSIDFPHSMGIFYTAFTQWLGFPHYGDEYKVMGLAPYGKPLYFEQLKEVVNWHPDGTFSLVEKWFRPPGKGYISYDAQNRPVVPPLFSAELEARFGAARKPQEPLAEFHWHMAASVQKMLEETVFHLAKHLYQATGLQQLCLAGGVAQNSVANGKITRHTPFTQVYVPPAGHDAGLAMGAAMYVYHQLWQQPLPALPLLSAYTGSHYSKQQIEAVLKNCQRPYQWIDDNQTLYQQVAHCIAEGGVVGWFRGRSEFGPRALGNRSILADPRNPNAKELLNIKIKRRESFRPFAPAILEEYAADFFEYFEPAPFMEKVFPIKKEVQASIPAVTHFDGTGRLQTVCRKNNCDFYELILTFKVQTGIPILLNTSFNENEPIVNSPKEALDCFERTSMDMLVLENWVITR